MKNFVIVCMALSMIGIVASCKKGSQPQTTDEVATQVASAICKRAIACTPNIPLKQEDCASQTVTSLTALMNEKKIQFAKSELEACLKTINEGTCEEVMNPQGPPKGCEKLQ